MMIPIVALAQWGGGRQRNKSAAIEYVRDGRTLFCRIRLCGVDIVAAVGRIVDFKNFKEGEIIILVYFCGGVQMLLLRLLCG